MQHKKLILEAKDLPLETLQLQIYTLPRLEFDAEIPKDEKTDETLFHVILKDNRIEDALKCNLLQQLFHFVGYSRFYLHLIEGPLAEKFLKRIEFNSLLTHIYTEYLIQKIDEKSEVTIWQSILLSPSKGSFLFKELLNHLAHHARILQYIECWMNSIQDKTKIPDIYDEICKLSDERMKPYLPIIKKIANCRILTIEYHEEEKCPHHAEKPEVESHIKQFLQMNENLFKKIGNPSAEIIYEEIQNDPVSHGKGPYLKKLSRTEHEVQERLREDNYEGNFTLSK